MCLPHNKLGNGSSFMKNKKGMYLVVNYSHLKNVVPEWWGFKMVTRSNGRTKNYSVFSGSCLTKKRKDGLSQTLSGNCVYIDFPSSTGTRSASRLW